LERASESKNTYAALRQNKLLIVGGCAEFTEYILDKEHKLLLALVKCMLGNSEEDEYQSILQILKMLSVDIQGF
jgi:hypothetical protein